MSVSGLKAVERLTPCVWPAFVLAACAASNSQLSTTNAVSEQRQLGVASAECYSLSYSEPIGSASARLFPIWLMLLPGATTGSVVGRHHPLLSDQDWAGVLKYSGWKRITPDSLEVMFTGNFEGIRIHVARTDANIIGRATWLTDLVNLPESSMRLMGTREQCSQSVSPST
jgi:hypothetical protein